MFNPFSNPLLHPFIAKVEIQPPRRALALEFLEQREVPSATLGVSASDITPPVAIVSSSMGTRVIASPNGQHHVTVTNNTNGSSKVVEDGKVVVQESAGLVGEVLFSPDSKHLAVVVDTNNGWHVIEDGKTIGSRYSLVSELTFSQDGMDLGYVIADPTSNDYEVVKNGNVVSGTYTAVGNLRFSQPNDELSFTAYQSETVPTGIIPMYLLAKTSPLNHSGEWGYAVSVEGPSQPTPTDPVTVVAESTTSD